MNHLAHLYLSQTQTDLLVGNFIADQVKGKKILAFSDGIQKGIEMHREIDRFTDEHSLVMESKKRLYNKYHKYSAVIVDMFYDHLLAKHWQDYSPISLSSFSQNCYRVLQSQEEVIPEQSKHILYYMKRDDWLFSYAQKEGLRKALKGLDSRAKFESNMSESVEDLYHHLDLFEGEFKLFFPQLLLFTAKWTRVDD